MVYAGGSLCKSCVQAGYRIGRGFAWSTGVSGFCLQSHLQALSLLLVVAGDVERNPGPLTDTCAMPLTYFTSGHFAQLINGTHYGQYSLCNKWQAAPTRATGRANSLFRGMLALLLSCGYLSRHRPACTYGLPQLTHLHMT